MTLRHLTYTSLTVVTFTLVTLIGRESAYGALEPTGPDVELHHAVLRGQVEVVESLLQSGANPNTYDDSGRTPLHWAVHGDNTSGGKKTGNYATVVQILLAQGADPNAMIIVPRAPPELRYSESVVGLAAKGCADTILDLLLKAGADPNQAPGFHFTPLHEASIADCVQGVELLIRSGALVNEKRNGGTPLEQLVTQLSTSELAAFGIGFYRDHVEVAKLLVQNGAESYRAANELRRVVKSKFNRALIGRQWMNVILDIMEQAAR